MKINAMRYRIFVFCLWTVAVQASIFSNLWSEQENVWRSPLVVQDTLENKIRGCVLGAAIGDAMGMPTEFLGLNQIFERYPHGIRSFNDFTEQDKRVKRSDNTLERFDPCSGADWFAMYTDDTRMAKLTLESLVQARKNNWSIEKTVDAIARAYIADMDANDGWLAALRAPGLACKSSMYILREKVKQPCEGRWWYGVDVECKKGGCGSVMRAHPFGIVFYDDVKKAETFAVEHSQLTHCAPSALAACAAMAVGTAYAIQHKDPDFIAQAMIAVAFKYDTNTGLMLQDVVAKARNNSAQAQGNAQKLFELSQSVFDTYRGWSAHEAIAASLYIFMVSYYDVKQAIYLGVHTPGDSDSLASMAGALVGAYVGNNQLPQAWVERLEQGPELDILAHDAIRILQ